MNLPNRVVKSVLLRQVYNNEVLEGKEYINFKSRMMLLGNHIRRQNYVDRSEIHIMLEEVWNAGDMSDASIVDVCKMMNKMTVDNLLATRTDLLEKVSQLYSI